MPAPNISTRSSEVDELSTARPAPLVQQVDDAGRDHVGDADDDQRHEREHRGAVDEDQEEEDEHDRRPEQLEVGVLDRAVVVGRDPREARHVRLQRALGG